MVSLLLSLQNITALLAGYFWYCCLFSEVVNGVKLKPIVLIPGLAGTGLFARLDNVEVPECSSLPLTKSSYRIWMDGTDLASNPQCWSALMSLSYQPGPHSKYINKPGVHITPDGYEDNSVEGFDYLDHSSHDHDQSPSRPNERKNFHDTIEAFKSAGYRDKFSMAGLPYDWRLPFWQHIGPVENEICVGPWAVGAKKLIVKMYKNNGNQKVVLIAHSLGTVMITVFLNMCVSRDWKNTYVDSYVSICGVYGGSIKTVRAILSGYNDPFVFNIGGRTISLLTPILARETQRTLGSFYSIAPRPEIYGEDYVVASIPLTNSSGASSYTLTVGNWTSILPPINSEMLKEAMQEHGRNTLKDPEVKVYCLYSKLDEPGTDYSFVYNTMSIDEQPNIIYGYGDNMVPVESAKYCCKWESTVKSHEFKNDHTMLLSDSQFIQFLLEIVDGRAH